ncbi:hypothetical protein [Burkholderia oklahomensis]|uniref:hypothetical protein n=1 Tax=Burkholderia oklahomensis TaxID=342113 RepID=UPI00016A97E2|nr:hypothetical protein [Burkholderia oklahomensis]AOI48282.1 hypothetical protein WI23_20585 [Burkholderia oklahomensis C6786]KUY52576.1 hypothetical protein WI23_24525 [Burkholderia oklahomensis C6786]MBI0363573.1 hypothetical protein [Burkholderia oklahomensis]
MWRDVVALIALMCGIFPMPIVLRRIGFGESGAIAERRQACACRAVAMGAVRRRRNGSFAFVVFRPVSRN